jgi:hypothetical protein
MMRCGDIAEYLGAYLEGTLESEYRERVDEHLAKCPSCLHELEGLRKTRDILADLDDVEPPPWLTSQIMSRIEKQDKAKGFLRRLFFPLHIKIPVQALATLLVIVVSVYVYRSTLPEMSDIRFSGKAPNQTVETGESANRQIPSKEKSDTQREPKSVTIKKKYEVKIEGSLNQGASRENAARSTPGMEKDEGQDIPEPPPEQNVMSKLRAGNRSFQTGDALSQSNEEAPTLKARAAPAREERALKPDALAYDRQAMHVRNHIVVLTDDPEETSRKTHGILRSLGAAFVREDTRNECIVISGRLQPEVLGELQTKLSKIAIVNEARIKTGISPDEQNITEIIIRKESDNCD